MNKNNYYFVEGSCEETIINSLKKNPSLLVAGKVRILNVVQNQISKSILVGIKENSRIIFVFDTDIDSNTFILKANIEAVKKYCKKPEIITIPQINNLEDELKRSTKVKKITDITKSKSISDFKRDFCGLTNCRNSLEKHNFDIKKLWNKKPKNNFSFIEQLSHKIKLA